MTSIEKHTPTPWHPDPDGYEEYIWGPEDQMIAQLRGHGAGLPQRTNAEFIVRAANAHDALLAACKQVSSELVNGQNVPSLKAMDMIESAIALAEKGQS